MNDGVDKSTLIDVQTKKEDPGRKRPIGFFTDF